MIQEPDFGSLLPDTFADLGNTSYGTAIDDYQSQMDDFDLKGPNAQFLSSNASYDEEGSSGTSDCCTEENICKAELADCEDSYLDLVLEYNDLIDELEVLCADRPPAGSWNPSFKVYANYNSGSCSAVYSWAIESVSARLSGYLTTNVDNNGNSGYKLSQSNRTDPLYREEKSSPFRILKYSQSTLTSSGEPLCLQRTQYISLKKQLIDGTYSNTGQNYIRSGSGGIGTYGVFYETVSSCPGCNKFLGTVIKEGSADTFKYTDGTDNPCGEPIPPIVNLVYSAGTNGSLSGSTNQTIPGSEGGTAVTATGNAGYAFAGWSDGSNANPRTDTNVTSDINVTANFAPI